MADDWGFEMPCWHGIAGHGPECYDYVEGKITDAERIAATRAREREVRERMTKGV